MSFGAFDRGTNGKDIYGINKLDQSSKKKESDNYRATSVQILVITKWNKKITKVLTIKLLINHTYYPNEKYFAIEICYKSTEYDF